MARKSSDLPRTREWLVDRCVEVRVEVDEAECALPEEVLAVVGVHPGLVESAVRHDCAVAHFLCFYSSLVLIDRLFDVLVEFVP